jgi:hypothetical protein
MKGIFVFRKGLGRDKEKAIVSSHHQKSRVNAGAPFITPSSERQI